MNPPSQDTVRDEFLSEEDLDLVNLTDEELAACWQEWFAHAQQTNDADRRSYSHGVFEEVPLCARTDAGEPPEPNAHR